MPEQVPPHDRVTNSDARTRWRRVIFDHDTAAGNAFDVTLIIAILGSVGVMMLDSVSGFSPTTYHVLYGLEWFFTLLFTVEYVARLWCAADRLRYARSFYGIVDLVATLPTYVSLLFPGGRFLALVRILRVLRVFRIFKLTTYVSEASVLASALRASRYKIIVFLFTVLTSVTVVGSIMYLVEGPESGFTSIPTSMYWAIVSLTTVGYGDIVPVTSAGRMLASLLMIMGYGVIAVPTGIVTLELQRAARIPRMVTCPSCGRDGHDQDANFCKECGARLPVKGVL
ncbi:MAG: ion transporter [Gemmatimonadaceae bacterium]|jgi:voltage-gated potassium channel|nr:ion transporter [Gemmatimonadaceae bacterium]